jgi:hypothetical protein
MTAPDLGNHIHEQHPFFDPYNSATWANNANYRLTAQQFDILRALNTI